MLKFFNIVSSLSKPQNNFISDCIVGMIKAESVVTTDIIKKLPRDYFDESLFSSKEKKFYRFFNNPRFNPYNFYDDIIYSKRVSANSNSCKTSNYIRLYSIFNTALILFNLVYESLHYYNLKFNFKLYDI